MTDEQRLLSFLKFSGASYSFRRAFGKPDEYRIRDTSGGFVVMRFNKGWLIK